MLKKFIACSFATFLGFSILFFNGSVAEAANENESNDSFSTANQLYFGKDSTTQLFRAGVIGNINSRSDDDYYRFRLSHPGKVIIKINSHLNTEYHVELFNSTRDELESYRTFYGENKGPAALFSQGLDAGTYYVKVSRYNGSYNNIPYYLQIDCTLGNNYEKEFNNSRSSADLINLNTTYHGWADRDDDYFAFQIPSSGEVKINLNRSLTTRYQMDLYDNGGTELEGWYTSYGDSSSDNIIYTGLPAGLYYIKINAYDGDRSNVPYQFKVNFKANSLFETEDNASISKADILPFGKTMKGIISWSDDTDYYRVTIPKDMSISLNITRPKDTRFYVRLFNQSYSIDNSYYTYYGNGSLGNISNLNLKKGIYYIKVDHYEGEKNKVPYSLKVVERDTKPPAVPSVNTVANNQTTITGKAEANSTVYAKVGSKQIGSATVDSKGAFTIKIAKQKAGTTIKVYAKDKSGNIGKAKAVKVIDKIAPAIPSVNKVENTKTVITGKAEANSTVYAKVGSKQIGSATVNSKGAFTIKIAKQKTGTTIKVFAKDKAGNIGKAKTIKVVADKTPPAIPSVNKVTTKSKTVTGKAEVGATVYVYNGNKKLGQATVSSKGTYSVKISAQKKGASLKVYAVDKAKNKSKTRTIKVQ